MTGCCDWTLHPNAWRKMQYATTAANSTGWLVPTDLTTAAITWGSGTGAYQLVPYAPYAASSGTIPAEPPWQILRPGEPLRLKAGEARTIELPDGAVLSLDEQGNYSLDDREAKVIYRANRQREWNRYVSAGDTLEDFMRYAGDLGVRRADFLALPVELFMKFLILQAAAADGEPPPEDVVLALPALPARKKAPRCLSCGRFVTRAKEAAGLPYCQREHMLAYAERKALFA